MFYIELPADEYGNTSMPRSVIEGQIQDRTLTITGPPDLVRYSGCFTDVFGGFAEVEGPARMLSVDEYFAILKTAKMAR
jgi:hypothetical protein